MRSSLPRVAATIVVGLMAGACTSATSPAPITTPVPVTTPAPSEPPASAPAAATPITTPPPTPSSALVTLPVRGSARPVGLSILMAPGPDDTLYVSVPSPGGSVLALLDGCGRPRPGWPIAVDAWTPCGLLLPVDDGSVRVVCNATDLPRPGSDAADVRAFAFDAAGRSMAGWPVQLRPGYWRAGRVVGDELTLVTERFDAASLESVTTVSADGSIRPGKDVPQTGDEWAVGTDGVAYGIAGVGGSSNGPAEVSRITAMDLSGVRTGWPVTFDGIASGPSFGPGGRIVMTAGSVVRGTSHVVVFDRDGGAVSAKSTELPIATADSGIDCVFPMAAPIVAQDGTTFVYSGLDARVFALDPSLNVKRGWPFEPVTPLERPFPSRDEEGLNCLSLAVPAVGPDSTLYLPLYADGTVGGSIVAIGRDGRVRPGWPIELKRPGSEFWSVVIGGDGTAYALAIEPEAGDASSATILAIAPDSTVHWTTTIVDP